MSIMEKIGRHNRRNKIKEVQIIKPTTPRDEMSGQTGLVLEGINFQANPKILLREHVQLSRGTPPASLGQRGGFRDFGVILPLRVAPASSR